MAPVRTPFQPLNREANATPPRVADLQKKTQAARQSLSRAATIANAQRRVKKSRTDVPPPAAPLSPPSPPPKIPGPTEHEMNAVAAWVKDNVPREKCDRELGESLARLLGPLGPAKDVFHVSEDIVRVICKDRDMFALPKPGGEYYPTRYKQALRRPTVDDAPIVFLDNICAPFVSSVTAGGHGFAYLCSPDFGGIPELGPFHLFNRPLPPQEGVVEGEQLTNRRWRYNGLYTMHKTPFLLSRRGWHQLSQQAQIAAATTHCQLAAHNAGQTRECSREAIKSYWAQLDKGTLALPLVLFQCIDFPLCHADMLLNMDCAQLQPLGRLPSKRVIPSRAVIEGWGTAPRLPPTRRR
ncbi:hypothetical protein BN946_scf185000.g63 [Trametes cinnabarina]|uniref:DUF6697 domain-containing protein n=1 Tax=Pycnoporus cinnabarinus TaxID=5643 RepID=A0A060S3P0_PYCCI|nr:hypothetical protein BN946_scf185000.g63 [Trametes cinnabarina]